VIDRNELAYLNGGLLFRMVFYGSATEELPHIFIIKATKKKITLKSTNRKSCPMNKIEICVF